mmetsp:Transcript_15148/g.33417  ORF Transcript_15148/g.33417 Transcript_15148/m.33417 type:complete len:776 (-) Transcript_15148:189-2516(-)
MCRISRFALVAALLGVLASASVQLMEVMEKRISRESFVKQHESDAEQQHELVFAVKKLNQDKLEATVLERSTPGSALYQTWMSFHEVRGMTENKEGSAKVLSWLEQNDIKVTWTSPYKDYIKATASVATWGTLLNTQFYAFDDTSKVLKGVARKYAKKGEKGAEVEAKGVKSLVDGVVEGVKEAGVEDTGVTEEGVKRKNTHRCDEYSLPSTLAPHLEAVLNTVQTPPAFKPKYHRKEDSASKVTKGKSYLRKDFVPRRVDKPDVVTDGTVTVSFLNAYYEISGKGDAALDQSVFETAEESFSPTDLAQFQRTYGVDVQAAEAPYGFSTTNCDKVDCYEGNLDIQYMMGLSQRTTSIYWYVTEEGTDDPFTDWVTDIANTVNPPLVNSMSWGSIEITQSVSSMNTFNSEALSLAAMGVTVLVSSGDDGVSGTYNGEDLCDYDSGSSQADWTGSNTWTGTGYFPSFPATSPYVTAVGATMGPEDGYPEIACQSQEGGIITTGGGFSTFYPQPIWQTEAVNGYFAKVDAAPVFTLSPKVFAPSSGYNPKGRAYPDISMIGVWYQVIVQGSTESLFGTSASAPVFGALISLLNAVKIADGKGAVGFLNPTLWAYGVNNTFGVNGTSADLFNDVTEGNNNCVAYNGRDPSQATCCDAGFDAAEGWDPVTGFGSIQYQNLATMFGQQVNNYTYITASDSSSDELSKGEAAAIGISVILVLIAVLLGVYCLCMAKQTYATGDTSMSHIADTPSHTPVGSAHSTAPLAAAATLSPLAVAVEL